MANSKVKNPQATPGRSEFSHGPGLDAPIRRGAVRTSFDEHIAIFRTDNLDPLSGPDLSERESPDA